VNRREVTISAAAPTKEASLIQSDLVVLSHDGITKGKRRAEAEAEAEVIASHKWKTKHGNHGGGDNKTFGSFEP
jgi:hypothetical protein